MTEQNRIDAVVADMDGVLTRTARLHEKAWKRMFDDFLESRQDEGGEDHAPFTSDDYREHVDGKPRYDGVADFLASRHIQLPRGDASDDPDNETVAGLGNRKNQIFREILDKEGVEVFDDAVAALERWRRGGLKLAIISSSRNCRRVLEAANLVDRVDEIVDGQLAAEIGLNGKPDLMKEAARRLQIEPSSGVILEDATAGVRAGKETGYGLTVGIDRSGQKEKLKEAGADRVTDNAYTISFYRTIPSALANREQILKEQGSRSMAVFLDYDGTLTPIVDDPDAANLSDEVRSVVRKLADRVTVAIVSGRDRRDVEKRVAINDLYYAGNHGFDIIGPDHQKTLPEAEDAVSDVDKAERKLHHELDDISGVVIERKRYSVAVHYRKVESESEFERVRAVVAQIEKGTSLRKRPGKKVFELEPSVDWNKGRAVRWLMEVLEIDPEKTLVMYIGDDDTDEDAFAGLQGDGLGIRVGPEVSDSLADYRVADPNEVRQFLEWLLER